jgi:hypothetical protein
MINSVKSLLIAGVLIAVAGSAYAQQQQPTAPTAPQQQLSYTPAAPLPMGDQPNPDHFVKPAGYDQNPAMYPYTRKGAGPKAN